MSSAGGGGVDIPRPAITVTPSLEDAAAQLDALARKLGVELWGCGCCESPWLTVAGDYPDPVSGHGLGRVCLGAPGETGPVW